MKFAINYSPEAAALVRSGAIDVDLFKCPAASDPVVSQHAPTLFQDARSVRPVYVHFPINTTPAGLSGPSWDEVDSVLDETETQYVNVHLYGTAAEYPDIPIESAAPGDLLRLGDSFIRGVEIVTARFGRERVIVENVVYTGPSGTFLRASTEPSVIRRVVDETGCGLLLDTAHARLTCAALGADARDYLCRLPTESLRELHVTGTGEPGFLRDSLPMHDDDWALFAFACGKIRSGEWPAPWACAFEYGGIGPLFEWRSDSAVIKTQAPRLRSIMQDGN